MYSIESGPSKIMDGLYLGNSEDSKNLKVLQELGIKYILVAGKFLDLFYPDFFVYKHIEINDHAFENIECHFEDAYEFIKDGIKNGGCFVHCAMGISRSASMIIAYLMKENSWKLDVAFSHVRQQRTIVFPNYGFQKQLKKFEIKLGLITEEEYQKLANERKFLKLY